MKKRTIIILIIDILAIICFILFYGPDKRIKTWFITTSMNTMTHKYFAYTMYSQKTITYILSENYYIPSTEKTDLDSIIITNKKKTTYENDYERQIFETDSSNKNNQYYKMINIKVGDYEAYLVAIYDPSKVKLITMEKFNQNRNAEPILKMCQRNNGLVCINGGGTMAPGGYTIDVPGGYVIKNGEIIWADNMQRKGNLIGFTFDNKLMLINSTGTEALNMGMRDAVEFSPFLIINGKRTGVVGNGGGYGKATRTAIGQRKDGVVLFLVVNGCKTFYCGPSMEELTDTLEQYGAYNAANLDGGASTTLIVESKLINIVRTMGGEQLNNGRYLTTGFALIP